MTDSTEYAEVSTHMPLARPDGAVRLSLAINSVSTHMPLARHDIYAKTADNIKQSFYSHASCEA